MITRICTGCGRTKRVSSFYNKSTCKQCHPRGSRRGRHRVVTAHERQWVMSYKAIRGCRNCGLKDPTVLDFHHRTRTDKVAAVSKLLASRLDLIAIVREIDKCEVICANCHRREHYVTSPSDLPLKKRLIHPLTDEVIQ